MQNGVYVGACDVSVIKVKCVCVCVCVRIKVYVCVFVCSVLYYNSFLPPMTKNHYTAIRRVCAVMHSSLCYVLYVSS